MSEVKKTERRKPIRMSQFIRLTVFLVILALLFHFMTLVYGRDETRLVLDFKTKPENTLDFIEVGSSNVYRYFSPMEGWEKYGISGYAYGVASTEAPDVIWLVKDVLKRQKPKVLALEARCFVSTKNLGQLGVPTYRVLKNYRNPFKRWEIIRHYCKTNDLKFKKDDLKYYLPLILEHENYWTMLRPDNWKRAVRGTPYVREPGEGPFMGYAFHNAVVPQPNIPYNTEIVKPIRQGEEKALREILDYCESIGQEVMIVSSPFVYTDEEAGELNYIGSIADEYGIPFLNANKDNVEIGINWSTDLYNRDHTNAQGALKYSNYVFDFVHEHYDFEDHRGDQKYQFLEEEDARYREKKAAILELIKQNIMAYGASPVPEAGTS